MESQEETGVEFSKDDIVNKALEELTNKELILDYEKHEKEIKEVLNELVEKEAKLVVIILALKSKNNMMKLRDRMSGFISAEGIGLIEKSLTIETYVMKVVYKSDCPRAVQILRKGNEFLPERMLETIKDIEYATVTQLTSVFLELFLLLTSCVGITVDLNEAIMRFVGSEVEVLVHEPAFFKELNKFLTAWNKPDCRIWEKATAIFYFLKDSRSFGIFWKFVKLCRDNFTCMTIRTIAGIVLLIFAAFATKGVALIARITIALDSSFKLAEKIKNVCTFSDMKELNK